MIKQDRALLAGGTLFPVAASGPHTVLDAVLRAFSTPSCGLDGGGAPADGRSGAEIDDLAQSRAFDPWTEILELASLPRLR
jgi:hypothetical protein